MKIFLIGPANSIHMLKWANGLAERECDVYLYSCHNPAVGYKDNVTIIKSRYLAPLGYVLNLSHLRWVISTICPDIINVHYATGYGTLSSLSKIKENYPILLSVWGSDVYDFPHKSPIHKWLVKKNLHAADQVASTSYSMADETRTLTPELKNMVITPFGVDLSAYADLKPEIAVQKPKLVIGTVKTMKPTYGIDVLIEAFALLLKSLQAKPRFHALELELRLVGGGEQIEELKTLANQLGIGSCVNFVGLVPHSHVPQELAKLDIYVALSRIESFGVAIIEAGAAGRPVVVSDVGGLPEVTVHGKTGFVVPRENPQAAADAIEKLVLDAELRHQMGAAGQKHVAEHYSWDACIETMLGVYQKTIKIHSEKN